MNVKEIVVETAQFVGFQRTVIGSLKPMETERAEFERWLSKGYAAGMEYLKRNPHFRTSPQLLCPEAHAAIVVSASYYTEPPPTPIGAYGKVANYAVGLDYHAVLRARLRELKSRLENALGRPILGKAFTDDVTLYEHGYAKRSGLGFGGKNTLIIGPKLMGSYGFVAELFTDLDLEPDEPYKGTCGECFRCGSNCPTGALTEPRTVNAGLCISYLTIENKDGIPLELRSQLGEWVFGCDLCQEICPYNQCPPQTQWKEFQPESGVGHYLDLLSVLDIKTEEEFLLRFAHTPLRRPKLRGLQRNALIVLGNKKMASAYEKLCAFAKNAEDPMLKEHAEWAIEQY